MEEKAGACDSPEQRDHLRDPGTTRGGKNRLGGRVQKTCRQGQMADPEDLGDGLVEFKRITKTFGTKA